MRTAMVVVALVVIAALVALLLQQTVVRTVTMPLSPRTPGSRAASNDGTTAVARRTRGAVDSRVAEPDASAGVPAKPDDAEWSGFTVLRDADDAPVAGAKIRLTPVEGGEARELVTEARGRARFDSNAAFDYVVVAAGMAKSFGRVGTTQDDGVVRLHPAGYFTGRVIDAATGRPIAGAAVAALDDSASDAAKTGGTRVHDAVTTDGAGEFRLHGVPALGRSDGDAPSFIVRAAADGFATIVTNGPSLGAPPWTIHLAAAGRVRGVVRGPDGGVVAGARVAVVLDLGDVRQEHDVADPPAVVTDDAGRFDVDGLRLDWTYRLRVEASGRAADVAGVCVTADESVRTVDVTLRGLAKLVVRVLSPSGDALARATVELTRGRDDPVRAQYTTDAERVARFDDVDPGPWSLVVLVEAAPTKLVHVDVADGEERTVDVTVDRGWTVQGKVVDDTGAAAAGDLEIGFDRTPMLHDIVWSKTKPDATGAFRLAGLGPDVNEIKLWRGGDCVRKIVVDGPTDDLRIVLPRPVEVRFSFKPSDERWIWWDAIDENAREIASDGKKCSGEATFDVPPCARLAIRPEGMIPIARDLHARAGESVDLGEIVFESGATLKVRVIDGSDHPVAGAKSWIWTPTSDLLESAVTDAAGAFEVTGMPAGDLEVEVEAAGFLTGRVPAKAGGAAALVVRLAHGGLLKARAADAAGRDVGDVKLCADNAASGDCEISHAGKPLVARVATGRWRVTATRGDDDVGTADVEVKEGGVHEVVVRIAR